MSKGFTGVRGYDEGQTIGQLILSMSGKRVPLIDEVPLLNTHMKD